jgi:hypothetical protein
MKTEQTSIWTIPALHEYFDRVVSDNEDKLLLAIKKDEEAVKTAKESMEHRLDNLNHVYAQMNQESANYLKKDIFDVSHKLVEQKIEGLQKLVYVGLGVWLVLQVIISISLLLIFKK